MYKFNNTLNFRMKNLFYLLFAVGITAISFTSCEEEVNCEADAANTAIDESNTTLNQALNDFNTENSNENCKRLEDAYEDHLDLLRDLNSCPDLDMMLLDDVIQITEEAANELNC